MVDRYFIVLAYDGARYHGWQSQPNATSVQQSLETALATLLQQPITIVGAGRTDAGVHATTMVAHFDYDSEHRLTDDELATIVYKLHKLLPADIDVAEIVPVAPVAHARFDALSRTYHYYLLTRHDVFMRNYAYHVHRVPDFVAMNEAAGLLLSVNDFTSFSKLHTDTKTNICRVSHACWTEVQPGLWQFEIRADRFLRNMVRAVVGTLLQVGVGKISKSDFANIVTQRNRCAAGDSVPGNALFLVNVEYPATIFAKGVLPHSLQYPHMASSLTIATL